MLVCSWFCIGYLKNFQEARKGSTKHQVQSF